MRTLNQKEGIGEGGITKGEKKVSAERLLLGTLLLLLLLLKSGVDWIILGVVFFVSSIPCDGSGESGGEDMIRFEQFKFKMVTFAK